MSVRTKLKKWSFVLIFLILFLGIPAIIVCIDLAKSFDNGAGFGLVFLPFIFFPMLGFGDANYQEPSVNTN